MSDALPYDVVIAQRLWEPVLRRLLREPGLVAVGTCRRNRHPGALELLVQDLVTTDDVPRGADWPVLADGVLLAIPRSAEEFHLPFWLERIGPRATQLWAVVLLGAGPGRAAWNGAIVQNGRLLPLDALRVIGPGMLRAARQEREAFTAAELRRWSRTRGALGDETWQKVAQSRVTVFGAGRSGSAVAFQLAALGVRHLTIADPDVLAIENLDAMFCVTERHVGRPKAPVLAERLVEFRADLSATAIARSVVDSAVVDDVRGTDLIVSAVDSDTPRLAAAHLARRFTKVHLDVGMTVEPDARTGRLLAADVRLLLPGQGCVCCVGGLGDEEEARYELLAPPGALRRRRPLAWHEQRAGSLITLNALTVGTAVQSWLDLLAGRLRGSQWQRFRWIPGTGLHVDQAPVDAARECPICRAATTG